VAEDATDVLAGLARLQAASRGFVEATDVDAVVESLIQRCLEAFDARGAVVALRGPDDTLEILASTYGELERTFDGVPLSQPMPLTDAVRSGEAIWLGERQQLEAKYPGLAVESASAAWIALPLKVGARVIGVLGIAFSRQQEWEAAQRLYLLTLADLCAIVLDRHVLVERHTEHERNARSAAEASARLSEALSAITAAVVNAVDDDVIARRAGERLRDTFEADGVLIARCDPHGEIEDVLFAHGYISDDIAALRSEKDRRSSSTSVVVAGRVAAFYEFPEEFLAQFPSRAEVLEQFGASAWTVAPLVAGNQVIGFFVVMFRSPHRFTSGERRFVATAADVVAQAMLRARSRAAEALARRSAEMLAEAIAAERARLAAVLHRMPAGLVVVDSMGGIPRVVLSNTRAAEILGPPPADDDAEAWLALRGLDGSPLPPHSTPLRRALRGDELADADDALVVRDDGTVRRIRASAVPIRDAEHRITSAVLVIEDVTEQMRRERDAQLLARVSDLLGSSGEVGDVLERVVSLAVPSFSDLCGVYVLDDDELHLYAVADRDEDRAERMRHVLGQPITVHGDTPVANAVRHGRSLMITRVPDVIEAVELDDDQRDWLQHVLRPSSVLVVPLRSGERVNGALTFTQTADTGRTFTVADLDVAIELATRCALLLEQVVAHRETADARDRADRLRRFAAAMARAASVDAVVQAIAVEGTDATEAAIVNVAMRSQQEASLDVLQTWLRRGTATVSWEAVDPSTDTASVEALHTGRSGYYPDLPAYRKRFGGERELALIDHGVQAVAAIPLRGSDGHVFGSIGFSFETAQRFDPEQCSFLETVADIAGQSLDRARLYERERDVARALQMALLPAALPELDDVTTEARYVAGGAGVSVGGDWYDVLRFTDGRVGLLIGDAAGRGIEAAALMGKVRHAAAALAMDRTSPAAVLAQVNEYLHNIASRRTMLTCCYIVLDRDRGVLRYSSAGHPPPLVIESDGEPRFLAGGRGVPLGVVPAAVYSDAEYQLAGPATIVLYTDGLVERRGETIDVGLARLQDAVRGHGVDVKKLCDHLTGTLLADGSDDDVALLAARVQSLATARRLDLELPADSRRLHELRTRVGRWLANAGIAPEVIPDVVIALNEAASNSMLHAYASTPQRGHVRVSVALGDDTITAVVADDGAWRQRRDHHDGRGLDLMGALMTEVQLEHTVDGTEVRLTRRLSV
jgi:GAF domain-containing protein/anti-sigma regulatory factor (Ser/Thr protein kinase)